jgi:3-hydroxyisobutyrate dehydrogenase
MSRERIAFLGLGNMGGPMCANLVKAGFPVAAYDLSPVACEAAANDGATVASSATGAAAGADVVLTMLPGGESVIAVWTSVLSVLRPDAMLIDCSTIDVESARRSHALAAPLGIASLDAPVSGGVGGAKAATLTFMAGGARDAFARAEPILLKMGRKAFHCGGAGAGQSAKICNNMLLAISMIGVCEALTLGEKLGLDHQVMFDVMTASSGRCWSLDSYCPVPGPVPASPANTGYRPGFATSLMLKDVRLSQAAAAAAGVATPLGEAAARLYAEYAGAGGAGSDFSGIITLLRGLKRSGDAEPSSR